jgi:hypothetical protein
MSCDKILQQLCDELAENIDSEVCEEIRQHLQICPHCSRQLSSLRTVVQLYRCLNEQDVRMHASTVADPAQCSGYEGLVAVARMVYIKTFFLTKRICFCIKGDLMITFFVFNFYKRKDMEKLTAKQKKALQVIIKKTQEQGTRPPSRR